MRLVNQETEIKKSIEFYQKCAHVMAGKAKDYSKNDDCFSNFKKIAQIVEIPVEKVFLVFMMVKIARIVELLKNGSSAVGESITDSLLDGCNYNTLMALWLEEKEA